MNPAVSTRCRPAAVLEVADTRCDERAEENRHARFGADAQAGTESLKLGVSEKAALVQFGQLPERLGGVDAGRGDWSAGVPWARGAAVGKAARTVCCAQRPP